MKRNEYLALHRAETETDPKTGRARRALRYVGPMYPIDRTILRRRLPAVWGGTVLALAAFITAGLTPAMGQNVLYTVAPFALTLLPLYFQVMAVIRITRIRTDDITEMQRQEGLQSGLRAGMGTAVMGGLWLIAAVVLMCRIAAISSGDWVFLCCAAASSAGGLLVWQQLRGLQVPAANESKT